MEALTKRLIKKIGCSKWEVMLDCRHRDGDDGIDLGFLCDGKPVNMISGLAVMSVISGHLAAQVKETAGEDSDIYQSLSEIGAELAGMWDHLQKIASVEMN